MPREFAYFREKPGLRERSQDLVQPHVHCPHTLDFPQVTDVLRTSIIEMQTTSSFQARPLKRRHNKGLAWTKKRGPNRARVGCFGW
jgi:hypothetical protein